MAEDASGGTTDGDARTEGDDGSENQDEKVVQLNESQLADAIKQAIAEGEKKGESKAHQKFQSQADKQVADVRKEAQSKDEKISQLEQQLYDRMTPEEQDREERRRIQEALAEIRGAKQPSQAEPDPKTSAPSSEATAGQDDTDSYIKQVRDETARVLKDAGIDPEKVKIGGNLDEFLKSVVSEAQAAAAAKAKGEQDEEDQDAKRNGVDSRKPGGKGKVLDLRTLDPMDLMKRGAAKRLQT